MNMVKEEILQLSAKLIAEEGLTYEAAKKRALKQLLGNKRVKGEFLPNNDEIEEEVRNYISIFMSDTQPERLLSLRKMSLNIMKMLENFESYVIGAVLNGTATDHSDIYLQLFVDSAKDVEIYLLNKHIDIEVEEPSSSFKNVQAIEIIHFLYQGEVVHLMVYEANALRMIPKTVDGKLKRASAKELAQLIENQEIGLAHF